MIIFGGTDGGNYFGDVWKFLNSTWTQLSFSDQQTPSERAYHSAVITQNDIVYIFGGTNDASAMSDVWKLDLNSLQFSKIITTNNIGARFFHGAVYLQSQHKMVIFAGDLGGVPTNQMYALNLQNQTWSGVNARNTIPSARVSIGMSISTFSQLLVVFGGNTGGTYSNELFTFNFDTLMWTNLTTTSGNSARSQVLAVTEQSNSGVLTCYAFGGRGSFLPNNALTQIVLNNPRRNELYYSIEKLAANLYRYTFTLKQRTSTFQKLDQIVIGDNSSTIASFQPVSKLVGASMNSTFPSGFDRFNSSYSTSSHSGVIFYSSTSIGKN